MAITHKRPASPGLDGKRKATFLLSVRLLRAIDDAVVGGASASKNAFVEVALNRAIEERRRANRRIQLQAAMDDPLFRQDIADVERDFRFADAETAQEIV
ncbi:MAG TPA: hypothetical protein VKT80_01770 [Chloroflexota bacterium]|nr:hypothetical protein [Chloroflexota bacterium]